jgi:hypothetical protein
MRTIRRFYFYLITLISLEVVVWGVIYLLWYTVLRKPVAGSSYLAVGLSLVLVGLPIFLLHWWVTQRDVVHDDEERCTRIRALFLYVIRLAALVPAVQNLIALLNRPILILMDQPATQALVGSNDTLMDNLVVIAVNLVVWVYFERILSGEWKSGWPGSVLTEVRRFSRYLWTLYGLGLAVTGIEQVISFIFYVPEGVSTTTTVQLGNALPLALVGVPLWYYTWRVIQSSLAEADELYSGLRLGVLYLLSLGGSITTLSTGAYVLYSLLRRVMGETMSLAEFFSDNNTPLASAVVLGLVWAYFGSRLKNELLARHDDLQRAELSRPYNTILSLLGNVATFVGTWFLLFTLAELLISTTASPSGLRSSLAGSLATILVGIPVWLRYWITAQGEAMPLTDLGDHARRSVVRKVYLYLAVFGTVVTSMVVAGMFFYRIINNLLGNLVDEFWLGFTQLGLVLILTLVWLAYHVSNLVKDGKRAQQALGKRHAFFPVLALFHKEDPLAAELAAAVKKQTPQLPLIIHYVEDGNLSEPLLPIQLLVLSSVLAIRVPAELAQWMANYNGKRLALPISAHGWSWQGAPQEPSSHDLAQETAQSIRRLAEGQVLRSPGFSTPWKVVVYIMASLFTLELLVFTFSLVMSLVMR